MAVNVYEMVTDRIIAELENGVIPWRKPWTGVRNGAYSRSTGRAYSLLNQMLLGKPGEYLTFKQALDAGGHVRKGEKSKMVVFWKMIQVDESDDAGEITKKTIPLLKYFNVFHIDQCEGIEAKYGPEDIAPFDPIAEAEEILAAYSARTGCKIQHLASNRACYIPNADRIDLPLKEQFPMVAEYYSVAFHEAAHSTGHVSRLNRLDKLAAFASEEYSKEELIAEIASASILSHLRIETDQSFRNSVAYVQSWIKVLRNDTRMIVSAASKAEKAVAYILDTQSA